MWGIRLRLVTASCAFVALLASAAPAHPAVGGKISFAASGTGYPEDLDLIGPVGGVGYYGSGITASGSFTVGKRRPGAYEDYAVDGVGGTVQLIHHIGQIDPSVGTSRTLVLTPVSGTYRVLSSGGPILFLTMKVSSTDMPGCTGQVQVDLSLSFEPLVALGSPGEPNDIACGLARAGIAFGVHQNTKVSFSGGATLGSNTTLGSSTIADTAEYRAFLGLDDPVVSSATWLGQTLTRCSSLSDRAANFVGVINKGPIPGETPKGKHSTALLGGGVSSDLHDLLDAVTPMATLKQSNVFRRASLPYEAALREAILNSEGDLQPADVMYLALRATNGSYPLAVLAAHNLLKEETYAGRDAAKRGSHVSVFAAKRTELMHQLAPAAALASKLAGLRGNPAKSRDKLGPWYHAFAILTVGAFWDPYGGLAAFAREHIFKQLGFFGPSEAGFNLEKAGTDYCFATQAAGGQLARLARP